MEAVNDSQWKPLIFRVMIESSLHDPGGYTRRSGLQESLLIVYTAYRPWNKSIVDYT